MIKVLLVSAPVIMVIQRMLIMYLEVACHSLLLCTCVCNMGAVFLSSTGHTLCNLLSRHPAVDCSHLVCLSWVRTHKLSISRHKMYKNYVS